MEAPDSYFFSKWLTIQKCSKLPQKNTNQSHFRQTYHKIKLLVKKISKFQCLPSRSVTPQHVVEDDIVFVDPSKSVRWGWWTGSPHEQRKKSKLLPAMGKLAPWFLLLIFGWFFCPKWLTEMMFIDFFRIKLRSKILGGLFDTLGEGFKLDWNCPWVQIKIVRQNRKTHYYCTSPIDNSAPAALQHLCYINVCCQDTPFDKVILPFKHLVLCQFWDFKFWCEKSPDVRLLFEARKLCFFMLHHTFKRAEKMQVLHNFTTWIQAAWFKSTPPSSQDSRVFHQDDVTLVFSGQSRNLTFICTFCNY